MKISLKKLLSEIVDRKISEIQMSVEFNPKAYQKTGGKRKRPKALAFPYYDLKAKHPQHFRLQAKDGEYTILVSRDVIEALGGLKDAGRNARSRQLTKLQDELRLIEPQTRRIILKGTEGQRSFPVMGTEMYILNWPVLGPSKTKDFLWLSPTQYIQEGITDFQIDEKYLD